MCAHFGQTAVDNAIEELSADLGKKELRNHQYLFMNR